MPMPRFRFTVRRMMVAMAILCVGLGGAGLMRRRGRYLEAAAGHRQREKFYGEQAGRMTLTSDGHRYRVRVGSTDYDDGFEVTTDRPDRMFYGPGPINPLMIASGEQRENHTQAEWARMATEHAKKARKYERAARYPWLPVAPDPPEPK